MGSSPAHIPSDLVALVSELAESYLERVSGDLRLIRSYLPPTHSRRVHGEHRLIEAKRLAALLRARKAAA